MNFQMFQSELILVFISLKLDYNSHYSLRINNSDCPEGYACPESGSTDGCMTLKDGQRKWHSGCFVSKNEEAGFEVSVANCAALCDEDKCCKGFAIGPQSLFKKNNPGCVLVTNANNCTRRYPDKGGYVGELLEDANTPSYYGFSGCFRKKVEGEYIYEIHSYEIVFLKNQCMIHMFALNFT